MEIQEPVQAKLSGDFEDLKSGFIWLLQTCLTITLINMNLDKIVMM